MSDDDDDKVDPSKTEVMGAVARATTTTLISNSVVNDLTATEMLFVAALTWMLIIACRTKKVEDLQANLDESIGFLEHCIARFAESDMHESLHSDAYDTAEGVKTILATLEQKKQELSEAGQQSKPKALYN